MNILLVNWQDRINPQAGGAETHLHEIFGRMATRGHRIRMVCSGWAGGKARETVDGIDLERHGTRNSFTLVGRRAVRRALLAERPDLVIEDINKVPLFLAGLTDRPFGVIVPHLFGRTIFQEASLPSATLVWALEKPMPRAYRRAWFQAISESTREDLVDRGVRRERITVIYPGVDSGVFSPDPAVPRTPHPSFVYVGRLRRYKGVEYALRALAVARLRRPDIRLEVAGRGEDQARLEGLSRELGLEDAVRFLGFVSETEKIRLFRSSWANVFPSPKEGWGITNVEAAGCGTPSLASDSPGLRDSVRQGETGYLVPHADATALAERMLALAEDPSLVAKLGRQARAFAEGLSWENSSRQTESWIEGFVRSKT